MTDSETAWELNFEQFREPPMWLEPNELVNGQPQVREVADLGSLPTDRLKFETVPSMAHQHGVARLF